jgi:RNA polymerase sigma-70 factor (ECF subfamily)
MSHVDEAGLARLAAAGDGDAFGTLVERYGGQARRVARSILGIGEDADDAVQDGMIAAWRAIGRYDPGRPFRPWLMRIVANAALDLGRRRKVRQAGPIPESAESSFVAPDRATDHVLFREEFRAALETLPERQRVAVVLFDAEGYSHAEIAEVLKVPEGTVRSYVFHARRALRRALGAFQEEAP